MPTPENPQRYEDMTFMQKKQMIEGLSMFPALTVMVFIRHRLGFRMLKPIWLVVMAALMLATPLFFPTLAGPFRFVMPLFAIVMLALGLTQRSARWKEVCAGGRWHTYSPGISYLEKLPLPQFFLPHRRVYRILDPIVCILAGVIVGLMSHVLGLWVIFSGLALCLYENAFYEKILARDLDILDNLLASEVQNETVEHFKQPQPEERQRTMEQTGGIPTGLDVDIALAIFRKQEKRKKQIAEGSNPS